MVSSTENDCCLPNTPCCGSARMSVIDYLERGLRRKLQNALPIVGEVRRDPDGRQVQFSLRLDGRAIQCVSFKSSSCVTLIAYCEVIAEWATGLTIEAAMRLRPKQVTAALPYVPPYKRELALPATAALLSAVQEAAEGEYE